MNGVLSKTDIDKLFMCEQRFGLSNVLIRDFLLLEYRVIENSENGEVSRDRDWIPKLADLNGYCLVPNKIRDEIPTIKNYLARRKTNML